MKKLPSKREIASQSKISRLERRYRSWKCFPEKARNLRDPPDLRSVLMSVEGGIAQLKLASGEIRKASGNCFATIGQVSNYLHNTVMIGKAGRSRWLGIRPTVRGTVMNPVDHPHGGGEGKQGIGLKHPKTPWGKPALGKKTRKKHKYSDKFIIKRRKKEIMSRSLKKGPYVDQKLIKKMLDKKPGDKSVIKTWSRASTIVPEMVGFTFGVHNGRDFISVFVTEEMVGHKLGEFSLTRKFIRHGGRDAKRTGSRMQPQKKAEDSMNHAEPESEVQEIIRI